MSQGRLAAKLIDAALVDDHARLDQLLTENCRILKGQSAWLSGPLLGAASHGHERSGESQCGTG